MKKTRVKKKTGRKKTGQKKVRKIKKILIANRGEIVLRIAETCKKMGIKTVGMHAEDDMNPIISESVDNYVKVKGKGVSIYLDIPKIIRIAKKNKVDAVHPGYGFLSENQHFARACEKADITFIGPSSAVLQKSADKVAAKNAAAEHGLATLPFSGSIKNSSELNDFVKKNGFPIILKSALGGGGRGMRIITKKSELKDGFESAENEVARCFGYSAMFVEKYVNGRHIEFQFLTDTTGRSACLFERECSIQRRFQKLIEEAPSTAIDQKTRKKICNQVCSFVSSIGYVGAGTIEFMVTKGKYYFMELNPRIQVEHGVTELITGVDLIREQIRIAEGRPLSKQIRNVKKKGHAIECRIVAENARKNFAPGQGTIERLDFPEIHRKHGRIDTAIYQGMKTKHHYDSLLAKILVKGRSREAAINKMLKILDSTKLEGIDNTISFHQFLLTYPKFKKGHLSTQFLHEQDIVNKFAKKKLTKEMIAKIATAIYEHERSHKIKYDNRWGQKSW